MYLNNTGSYSLPTSGMNQLSEALLLFCISNEEFCKSRICATGKLKIPYKLYMYVLYMYSLYVLLQHPPFIGKGSKTDDIHDSLGRKLYICCAAPVPEDNMALRIFNLEIYFLRGLVYTRFSVFLSDRCRTDILA